jgi:hypothetical protein
LKSANIWYRPARWRVAVEALEQLGHPRCCVLG